MANVLPTRLTLWRMKLKNLIPLLGLRVAF